MSFVKILSLEFLAIRDFLSRKLLFILLSCITGHCNDLSPNTCLPQPLNYNTSDLRTDYNTDEDGCFNPEEMKATMMYQHYLKVCRDCRTDLGINLFIELQFSFVMGLLTIVIGSVGLIGKSCLQK